MKRLSNGEMKQIAGGEKSLKICQIDYGSMIGLNTYACTCSCRETTGTSVLLPAVIDPTGGDCMTYPTQAQGKLCVFG